MNSISLIINLYSVWLPNDLISIGMDNIQYVIVAGFDGVVA